MDSLTFMYSLTLIEVLCSSNLIAKLVPLILPSGYPCTLQYNFVAPLTEGGVYFLIPSHMGWPCDLLWATECGKRNDASVPSLGLARFACSSSISWNPAAAM